MKPSACLAITATIATFLTTSAGYAARPPAPTEDSPAHHPPGKVSVEISHDVPHIELTHAPHDLKLRLAQADRAAVHVNEKTIATTGAGASVSAVAPGIPVSRPGLKSLWSLGHQLGIVAPGIPVSRPGLRNQPSQPLLILTRELDTEAQSQLQEDLLVMSRILEKAAQPEASFNRGPRAMGIDLVLAPGVSPTRNLYVDGFGAVFMLNVGFPLLPTDTEDTGSKESKTETETIWEQTRQEMYGSSESDVLTFVGGPSVIEIQPYDEKKMEALRDSLIEAVKNAVNIRHLADNDSVTICVTGAPVPGGERRVQVVRQESGSKEEELATELVIAHHIETNDASNSRSVMTIQASKADIDQFAQGKLSLDQFRNRARTHTYKSRGSNDLSPNTFIWTNR